MASTNTIQARGQQEARRLLLGVLLQLSGRWHIFEKPDLPITVLVNTLFLLSEKLLNWQQWGDYCEPSKTWPSGGSVSQLSLSLRRKKGQWIHFTTCDKVDKITGKDWFILKYCPIVNLPKLRNLLIDAPLIVAQNPVVHEPCVNKTIQLSCLLCRKAVPKHDASTSILHGWDGVLGIILIILLP